ECTARYRGFESPSLRQHSEQGRLTHGRLCSFNRRTLRRNAPAASLTVALLGDFAEFEQRGADGQQRERHKQAPEAVQQRTIRHDARGQKLLIPSLRKQL